MLNTVSAVPLPQKMHRALAGPGALGTACRSRNVLGFVGLLHAEFGVYLTWFMLDSTLSSRVLRCMVLQAFR